LIKSSLDSWILSLESWSWFLEAWSLNLEVFLILSWTSWTHSFLILSYTSWTHSLIDLWGFCHHLCYHQNIFESFLIHHEALLLQKEFKIGLNTSKCLDHKIIKSFFLCSNHDEEWMNLDHHELIVENALFFSYITLRKYF